MSEAQIIAMMLTMERGAPDRQNDLKKAIADACEDLAIRVVDSVPISTGRIDELFAELKFWRVDPRILECVFQSPLRIGDDEFVIDGDAAIYPDTDLRLGDALERGKHFGRGAGLRDGLDFMKKAKDGEEASILLPGAQVQLEGEVFFIAFLNHPHGWEARLISEGELEGEKDPRDWEVLYPLWIAKL